MFLVFWNFSAWEQSKLYKLSSPRSSVIIFSEGNLDWFASTPPPLLLFNVTENYTNLWVTLSLLSPGPTTCLQNMSSKPVAEAVTSTRWSTANAEPLGGQLRKWLSAIIKMQWTELQLRLSKSPSKASKRICFLLLPFFPFSDKANANPSSL